MLSIMIQALKKFDNSHEFERMAADILNSTDNTNVALITPRGGSDGGKDTTYILPHIRIYNSLTLPKATRFNITSCMFAIRAGTNVNSP